MITDLIKLFGTVMWSALNPAAWYRIVAEHTGLEALVGVGVLLVGVIIDLVLLLCVTRWILAA